MGDSKRHFSLVRDEVLVSLRDLIRSRGYGGVQLVNCLSGLQRAEGQKAQGGKTRTITGPHPALDLSSVGAKQPP